MQKELEEAKKKVVEYKSSKNFLDGEVEESMRTFYEGFKDCQNKVKELFPAINTTILIPSITNLIVEEVTVVQEDIGTPIEALPLTTPNATHAVEVPSNIEVLVETQLEALPEALKV